MEKIKVKFYGKLRKKAPTLDETSQTIGLSLINAKNINNVRDVLQKFGINPEKVSHIFVNGKYSDKNKKIKNGDTIAIFPKEMATLYKWYFNKE